MNAPNNTYKQEENRFFLRDKDRRGEVREDERFNESI